MSMSETTKATYGHLDRCARVPAPQPSVALVEHARESTERQVQTAERVFPLGWAPERVQVVVNDLGVCGTATADGPKFTCLTREVGLRCVGILILDVSRLARNKASRGESRRGLPVGPVWDEGEVDVCLHPDQPATASVRTLFQRIAESALAGQLWLWFGFQELAFPTRARTAESPGTGGVRERHTDLVPTRRQATNRARGDACTPLAPSRHQNLRGRLPPGFLGSAEELDVCLYPDQPATVAARIVSDPFAERGSLRQLWLWFGSQELAFPTRVSRAESLGTGGVRERHTDLVPTRRQATSRARGDACTPLAPSRHQNLRGGGERR